MSGARVYSHMLCLYPGQYTLIRLNYTVLYETITYARYHSIRYKWT